MPKQKRNHRSKPQQLLVEGKNDCHVVWALCKKYTVPENFDVIEPGDREGIDAVLEILPITLEEANLQTLEIVVDADKDVVAR